eukprot:7090765-Prymnesium_polylepis.1
MVTKTAAELLEAHLASLDQEQAAEGRGPEGATRATLDHRSFDGGGAPAQRGTALSEAAVRCIDEREAAIASLSRLLVTTKRIRGLAPALKGKAASVCRWQLAQE